MDWFGNRFNERYDYVEVTWDGWAEKANYDYITSGSIEISSENDLKVSGSFNFDGLELPNTNNLIRVYYSFEDKNKDSTRVPLATFFVTYSDVKHFETEKGLKTSGTLNGLSVLSCLDQDRIGKPLTIRSGASPIFEAQKIITNNGLQVDFVPSIAHLKNDYTFSAGSTKLEIVNYLCDVAEYNHAWPDANGMVHLTPHRTTDDVSIEFVNDESSIIYSEIDENNEWLQAPNVYKLLYNTDIGCVTAEARNVSGSLTSLNAVGNRENVTFEEVSDITSDKNSSISSELRRMAENKLREASSYVEYLTFAHAYYPIYIYDYISVTYSDDNWTGDVVNMSIDLTPATKTQTKIKRITKNNIVVEVNSEVLRTYENLNPEDV